MDDAALYALLQGAIKTSKGAVSWTDVLCALMRAKEAKVRVALDSMFADFSLELLARGEKIADKEVFKVPPPLPKAKK